VPEEAKIFNSAPLGMTLAEICSGTGDRNQDALAMCQRLEQQQLIDYEAEVYRIKPHLQDFSRGNQMNPGLI